MTAHRLVRWTAVASVLAVAGVAAWVSYWCGNGPHDDPNDLHQGEAREVEPASPRHRCGYTSAPAPHPVEECGEPVSAQLVMGDGKPVSVELYHGDTVLPGIGPVAAAQLAVMLWDLAGQAVFAVSADGSAAGCKPANLRLDTFALETEGAEPVILADLPQSSAAIRLTLDEATEVATALTDLASQGRASFAHNKGFDEGHEYALACAANWLEWDLRDGKSPQETIDHLRGKAGQEEGKAGTAREPVTEASAV
jgi:hypothetical protein